MTDGVDRLFCFTPYPLSFLTLTCLRFFLKEDLGIVEIDFCDEVDLHRLSILPNCENENEVFDILYSCQVVAERNHLPRDFLKRIKSAVENY